MYKNIFNRVEKKYLLNDKQYNIFINKIKKHMTMDEYGIYTISNIYFDSDDFSLIRNSIEKPAYKEKIRLRGYGKIDDESTVFLEIKKKYIGVVNKRRISININEALKYLNCEINIREKSQISKEIDYFIKYYNVHPKVLIAYDRVAYYKKEDDFRVTIDNNIRSRTNELSLKKGNYGELYFKDNKYLVEVKCNGGMPLWFVEILSDLKLFPTSFSKYGNIYKEILINKKEENNV